MNHKDKVIFYYPAKMGRIESGSGVRPQKMLEYMSREYDVLLISGSWANRRKQQIEVMKSVLKGERYKFVYFENMASPHIKKFIYLFKKQFTLVSLKEFWFLLFLKLFGSKVLYYFRDLQWLYPEIYHSRYSRLFLFKLKALGTIELYLFWLIADILVPNQSFGKVMKSRFGLGSKALPPGGECNHTEVSAKIPPESSLHLFYVGGCGHLYDPTVFFEGLNRVASDMLMTYCTREKEFLDYTKNINIPENVEVVHLKGESMRNLMAKAHIAVYLSPPIDYIKIALSVKVPEYIAMGLPIICYKGTYLAEMIENERLGWVVDYSPSAVAELLDYLSSHMSEVVEMRQEVFEKRHNYSWAARMRLLESYVG